jgi:predicted lipid-binding transport protein (Tim44 family)
VPPGVPPYDPDVIERFAAHLDARARALVRGATLTGAAVGALVGAVPLSPLGEAWPIPAIFGVATLLAGALVGALIGFVVGSGRAELHRLHAQTVLCQLHAQRATLAIWRMLRDREQAREAAPAAPPVAVRVAGLD